ncbi:substrate-binding domain-containing protein [Streptacidiphilus jiangxiensis]|uniref:Molybdate transport system substrate-binding protein n=1 Tax=Streptacidiphilus jiangxiensis TaxID=235985 RepID=A0A1H7HFQ1_STRJI|nr:substrate-binding domain-containing protein [Streptacidiphilus jiangxiensis]SEK48262.1 molybdate transport system substrate-binding protein [Streptacidiphilus jiangxiensis]
MHRELSGLSSMATRVILSELSDLIRDGSGDAIRFESGGGVDIARRVRAGAEGDLLVLADDAMAALAAEGHLVEGTVRPLWISQVVAAVPAGTSVPAFGTEEDLRTALLGAGRIAYSTGPSGTAVVELIDRLGLAEEVGGRLVQAPPGVPVGSMLAPGAADLAFQQHSELMDLPGIVILGPLPGSAAISSTFTGGVLATSPEPARAATVLDLLGSDTAARTARAKGMRPATETI